jgi:RNA polymerase sigma factor (sigma-70 family)
MASASVGDLGRHLGRLFGAGSAVGLTDGELLERFAHRRDEAASAAFETLLARHGSMVLTVCRQVLGDAHAAEDAFQAAFLVLVRRAASLRVREPGSLGPWLHGVAYRIALKARQGAARRRARERRAAMPAVGGPSLALEQGELQALLHEEVNRLPTRYRAPVVLCYLEGRTHDEAAAALRWPVGTVRGRLARARDRLRARLTRRGLAPSGWVGATLIEPIARLEPSTRLLEATVAAAIKGMPATAVGAMAKRMLRSLLLARLGVTAGVLAMALMMAGFGLALRGAPASQARQRSETTPRADTTARIVSTPIDRRADPLPEHARLRIGGTRFNHGTSIRQVLYTPDGKSMVAIDGTGAVLVWDAATGRMVRAIGGPRVAFRDIALSPDGLTLATLDEPGVLRLWDLASGRERRRWHEVPGYPTHLTFSPDGRTLAAGLSTRDQTTGKELHAVTLWDLTSPTEHRRRFAADWRDLYGGLAFTPDGKALVTGSNDTESRIVGEKPERGSTRLWDVATG